MYYEAPTQLGSTEKNSFVIVIPEDGQIAKTR
jgi:hypothetical protein